MRDNAPAGSSGGRAFEAIDAMFHPRSIAVIGATERPGYGARVINNLIRTKFGGRIFPINPSRSTVFAMPCYPSPLELPEAPDLAMVIVPAERALEPLRQCAQIGVPAAIVISAGFAELPGVEGRQRQAELSALAAETGLRIVGPNCLGVANVADSIWATAATRFNPEVTVQAAGAAIISQSGASAFGPLLAVARDRGLDYRYMVSTGNEADLGASDFVEYFLERPDVRVICLLLEGIRDFGRLRRLAERALRLEKALVMLKVGRSEVGQRAARSHTAAMTGSDRVQAPLFRQIGIARVRDYDELIEQTAMFMKTRLPAGPRIGVVSHSGGIGAHLADQLGFEGLEVPPYTEATRTRLADVLGQRGSPNNPADLTTFLNSPAFGPMLDALLADPGLDAYLIATQGTGELVGKIVAAAESVQKPVGVVWTGSHAAQVGLPTLQASPVPVFLLPSGAARGMAALVRFARDSAASRERSSAMAGTRGNAGALCNDEAGALSEHRSKRLVAQFGIDSPPETLCQTPEDAVAAAEALGYPVVLKACGSELAHKTELGLVRLDLRSADDVRQVAEDLLETAQRAGVTGLEGILVQPLVRGGVETIVGLSDDPQLGPLLMLGLGGTLIEALGAVIWRACPIDAIDAEAMIDEVPALPTLLRGARGAPPADRSALVRALLGLSDLALALGDRLETVDVNPLLVRAEGQGVIALDALAVLRAPRPRAAASSVPG